jgi:hypothetical protein
VHLWSALARIFVVVLVLLVSAMQPPSPSGITTTWANPNTDINTGGSNTGRNLITINAATAIGTTGPFPSPRGSSNDPFDKLQFF